MKKNLLTLLLMVAVAAHTYGQRVEEKEPGTAFVGSLFIPGLGQFYNGQTIKGSLMVLVYGVSLIGVVTAIAADVPEMATPFAVLWATDALISATDAAISAKAINRRNGFYSLQLGSSATLALQPNLSLTPPPNTLAPRVHPTCGVTVSLNF